jgi:hypothetical protein
MLRIASTYYSTLQPLCARHGLLADTVYYVLRSTIVVLLMYDNTILLPVSNAIVVTGTNM